jgi:hypothetical protein
LEQAAVSAAKLAAFDVAKTKQAPRVYLFKIIKKDGRWRLVGAQGETVGYDVPATK